LKQNTWIDVVVRVFAVGGIATPSFWLGIMSVLVVLNVTSAVFGTPWMPPIEYVPIWQDPDATTEQWHSAGHHRSCQIGTYSIGGHPGRAEHRTGDIQDEPAHMTQPERRRGDAADREDADPRHRQVFCFSADSAQAGSRWRWRLRWPDGDLKGYGKPRPYSVATGVPEPHRGTKVQSHEPPDEVDELDDDRRSMPSSV